jgi:hypothetical protein
MAHEVGHLKGILEDDKEHEADEDAYADAYALNRIKEVIEDSSLRVQVTLTGVTNCDFIISSKK